MTGIFLGYPKSGSTTIQQWLSEHPGVVYQASALELPEVPDGKIAVIGDEGLAVPYPSMAEIGDRDVDGVIPAMRDGQALRDEQVRVCETLARKYADAKILLVTRGAASVVPSAYGNYVKFGGTTSFENYSSQCESYFRVWLDYDFLVDLYQQHFGAGRVMVLPAELLFGNPVQFWRLLEEFWELAPGGVDVTGAHNQALYKSSMPLVRRISTVVKTLLRPLPGRVRRSLWDRYVFGTLNQGGLSGLEKLPGFANGGSRDKQETKRFLSWQTASKLIQADLYFPFRHLYTSRPGPTRWRPILKDQNLQAKIDDDGYAVIDLLGPEEVSQLLEAADDLMKDWDRSGIFTSIDAVEREGNYWFDGVFAALLARKMKALTSACYLNGVSFLVKGTGGDTEFPIHQDFSDVDETRFMTYGLWLPLVDTDGADGGLCVIPQSHRKIPFTIRSTSHPSLYLGVEHERAAKLLRPLRVKAGQACIFAHNLFHGSRRNGSGQVRPIIHAGIYPYEARQVHYYVEDQTVEEIAINREFYYTGKGSQRDGSRPAGPVCRTFPLREEYRLSEDRFFQSLLPSSAAD